MDAINDAFLLESSIYRLLKLYCREQPYYLDLIELFLQVCRRRGLPRWPWPLWDILVQMCHAHCPQWDSLVLG